LVVLQGAPRSFRDLVRNENDAWDLAQEGFLKTWQSIHQFPRPRANYRLTEIRQHINVALAQLSPEHRAVIVLKEIEDLQYQEIAEVLNVSVGTVMSRLFYGRKKLQSILRPIFQPK
jgi:DNA-directed RNA polymerase specialized sigma24 family protein